jgi:hypothetical protein
MKNKNWIVKGVVGLLVMVCLTACPKDRGVEGLEHCITVKALQNGVAIANVTVRNYPPPRDQLLWVGYTTTWDASHQTEAEAELKKVVGYICKCLAGNTLPSGQHFKVRVYETKEKLEAGLALSQSGPGSGGDDPILAAPKPGGGPDCTCTGAQSTCQQ